MTWFSTFGVWGYPDRVVNHSPHLTSPMKWKWENALPLSKNKMEMKDHFKNNKENGHIK